MVSESSDPLLAMVEDAYKKCVQSIVDDGLKYRAVKEQFSLTVQLALAKARRSVADALWDDYCETLPVAETRALEGLAARVFDAQQTAEVEIAALEALLEQDDTRVQEG